jgi:hypothetical protein
VGHFAPTNSGAIFHLGRKTHPLGGCFAIGAISHITGFSIILSGILMLFCFNCV